MTRSRSDKGRGVFMKRAIPWYEAMLEVLGELGENEEAGILGPAIIDVIDMAVCRTCVDHPHRKGPQLDVILEYEGDIESDVLTRSFEDSRTLGHLNVEGFQLYVVAIRSCKPSAIAQYLVTHGCCGGGWLMSQSFEYGI